MGAAGRAQLAAGGGVAGQEVDRLAEQAQRDHEAAGVIMGRAAGRRGDPRQLTAHGLEQHQRGRLRARGQQQGVGGVHRRGDDIGLGRAPERDPRVLGRQTADLLGEPGRLGSIAADDDQAPVARVVVQGAQQAGVILLGEQIADGEQDRRAGPRVEGPRRGGHGIDRVGKVDARQAKVRAQARVIAGVGADPDDIGRGEQPCVGLEQAGVARSWAELSALMHGTTTTRGRGRSS